MWNYCPYDGRRFREDERLCPQCYCLRVFYNEKNTEFNSEKPWIKVLYLKQNYPDNYTDPSIFLNQLQMNPNKTHHKFWDLFLHAGNITQRIGLWAIFLYFYFLYKHGMINETSAENILYIVATAFCTWYIVLRNHLPPPDLQIFKGFIVIIMAFHVLTPVVRSLADTISTDTIYAMVGTMLFMDLLFYSYGSTSLNMASGLNYCMFASICLASRLDSSYQAFTFLLYALETFALVPYVSRLHCKLSDYHHLLITSVYFVGVYALTSTISEQLAIMLSLAQLIVLFVCPVWLLLFENYKRKIHGPWDEANLHK